MGQALGIHAPEPVPFSEPPAGSLLLTFRPKHDHNSRSGHRQGPSPRLLLPLNYRHASADTESTGCWAKVASVRSTWPATISFSGTSPSKCHTGKSPRS